jgi:hypothetical protein
MNTYMNTQERGEEMRGERERREKKERRQEM